MVKPHLLLPLVLLLAACGGGSKPAAVPAPGPDPGWTGLTLPMDVIRARDAVMKGMEQLMVPIDTIQVEPVRSADQLRANAKAIAAMLLAVPHLFPPTTNLYDPKLTEPATLALPAIWKNFDTFYQMATAASRAAEAMGTADGDVALRATSNTLRASCTACHTLFLRKYVPQKAKASDTGFDFDAALDTRKEK